MIDPSALCGRDVAIGFFDGVHIGHRRLLEKANDPKLCLTFSLDLAKRKKCKLIDTPKEKEMLLNRLGFPVLSLDFSLIRSWSKDEFLRWLRERKPRRILVGEDFRFGKGREGNARDLLSLSDEIEVTIVPLFATVDGIKVSSTRIRTLLTKGLLDEANSLLGYPYFMLGEVIHGRGNGHKIGFPTANIKTTSAKVALPTGVYRTSTIIDGKVYPSMTNVGKHPTIDPTKRRSVETNILDFDSDLYGKTIEVRFHAYLRPQIKFSSLDELKKQLFRDRKESTRLY